MFTSRAEFRLLLRADNADQRLTEQGRALGLVGDQRWAAFSKKRDALEKARTELSAITLKARDIAALGANLNPDSPSRTALQTLELADVGFDDLLFVAPLGHIAPAIRNQLKNDALYANYIRRQARDIDALQRDETVRLPLDMNYKAISGLSAELASKLATTRPANIAQAKRIEGMTPAAILLLISAVSRRHKRTAS